MSRCRTLCVGLLLAVFALPVATADARRITFGERDLRQGMHGTDVRVLQGFLTKAGIKTSVDGQYGPATTPNVRRWERKVSLPVDGVVTREDAATLRGQVEQGTFTLQNTAAAPVAAPTANATLGADGLAIAPAGAPPEVVAVIAAANEIVGKPYRYGGGHGDWEDSGYDCSGSESYALHGADLVSRPHELDASSCPGESRAKASGSPATRTAVTPSSWSPACDSTPATTTRRAPARSGRTRCARRTATPSVTPKVSELVVLAVSHHRAFFDDRPVARATAEEEQRDHQADDADDHQDDPDGRDVDAGDVGVDGEVRIAPTAIKKSEDPIPMCDSDPQRLGAPN